MRQVTLLTYFSLFALFVNGQNDYYWSSGKKHYLKPKNDVFIIKIDQESDFQRTIDNFKYDNKVRKIVKLKNNIGIVITGNSVVRIKDLIDYKEFSNVIPAFKLGELPIYLFGEILMHPKNNIPLERILSLTNNRVSIKSKTKYNSYVLETNDWDKLLEYSNLIYESGLVEYCHPNFIAPREKFQINDPKYSEQYYLNNLGQFGGTIGIDINAPEAWSITTGSCPVRVAVVDDGIEDHEDLNGRVLEGFTPQFSQENPDTHGAPNENDPPSTPYFPFDPDDHLGHGQCCAGIIAASHNSIGIRGIAPNVDIVPINVFNDWHLIPTFYNGNLVDRVLFTEDAHDVAEAVDFAWDDAGADIISNSWGYPTSNPNDIPDADAIIYAINRARTQGRNGMGSIVVFASGNSNLIFSGVTFPANVNGVITVGAIDKNGNIWNYSSCGTEMDFVAPSGGDPGDIRTVDREDDDGFSDGNYYDNFNGTSAACPQVSGVVALMLSVNPNLTEAQVRTLLQQTATDMGTAGFDNTFGYGLVNAYAAVLKASGGQISGPSLICNSNTTFSLLGITSGLTINWDCSISVLTQVGSNHESNYIVKPKYSTTSGEGWVRVRIITSCGDTLIRQESVWVGSPSPEMIDITNIGPYYPGGNQICANRPNDGIINWNPLGGILEYDWQAGNWQVVQHPMDPFPDIPKQNVQLTAPYYGYDNPVSVTIRARNQCGWGNYLAPAIVLNGVSCGGYYLVASPNPAGSYVELTLIPEADVSEVAGKTKIGQTGSNNGFGNYQIQLWSEQGGLLKTAQSDQLKLSLPVRDLPEGKYYLHLLKDGNIYKQQLLIQR
jgi:subtilisin family serine protease